MNKKNFFYLVLMIFLGGFIGSILGEILGFYLEEESFLHVFFTKGISLGMMKPVEVELKVLSITFGLKVKFTFLSILGFFFGIFLFKKAV